MKYMNVIYHFRIITAIFHVSECLVFLRYFFQATGATPGEKPFESPKEITTVMEIQMAAFIKYYRVSITLCQSPTKQTR